MRPGVVNLKTQHDLSYTSGSHLDPVNLVKPLTQLGI